ncbi:MAG: hypothetical protein KDA89_19965, partial [Planctomycetaceae bacterium]|nr:hypothetical protein [Planctomycetaceae bacterium]
MASPFKFFRKYSTGMMIVLVILSMLIFTLDSLFSDDTLNLWLLGLLIGGAAFGVAGIGQGRWLQWGIGGALLGAALGFIMPGFVEGNGLSTSLGVIDEEQIQNMEMRRAVANQVLMRAMEEAYGPGAGQMAPFFGFRHQSNREDVIFGKLMRAEASRLGIAVDSGMVSEYLKTVTGDKLTTQAFVNIRNGLSFNNRPMTDEELFEILGDELKAQLAYLTLRPRTTALPPAPEVYWEYFRRLNVRQQLVTAAIDVEAFLDQVPDPSDAEVGQFFAQYRNRMPVAYRSALENKKDPGAPGFRLPLRAKVAWVELDRSSVEAAVGEITDADIEKYYNDNKETPLIRRPVFPDKPADTPTENSTEPGDASESKGTEKPEGAAEPKETSKPGSGETSSSEDGSKNSEPAKP